DLEALADNPEVVGDHRFRGRRSADNGIGTSVGGRVTPAERFCFLLTREHGNSPEACNRCLPAPYIGSRRAAGNGRPMQLASRIQQTQTAQLPGYAAQRSMAPFAWLADFLSVALVVPLRVTAGAMVGNLALKSGS